MTRRVHALLASCAVALAGTGCGSTDTSAYVRLPEAKAPSPAAGLERAVGELLGTDPEVSQAAEARLLALDPADLALLEAHAARIPAERDPRWLHVLDEHHRLPPLEPAEHVAFLVWKAGHPEPFFAMKARSALAEEARRDPAPLLAALKADMPGRDSLAVALAMAQRTEAVPLLLDLYVADEDERDRRALAEALTRLLGEETRMRPMAPRDDREREATRLKKRFLLGRADLPNGTGLPDSTSLPDGTRRRAGG